MSRVDRVAVLGGGVVGARLTRELVSGSSREVTLFTARPERAAVLGESFGPDAEIEVADNVGPPQLTGFETVVLAGEPSGMASLARASLESGGNVVAVTDSTDASRELLALSDLAESCGGRVVVGAAFSPGLSCLVAAFAALRMDRVEEIRVCRMGVGGPGCAREMSRALRAGGVQWRDGGWVRSRPGSGRELAWFPEPVGARDCYLVGTAEPLVWLDAFPSLRRAAVRMAMTRRDRLLLPFPALLRPPAEGVVGAIRVEVRGVTGGECTTEVLGAIDRPAVSCSALVAQVLEDLDECAPPGAHGLASWSAPGPFLERLRERGVRVAISGT